MFVEARDRFWWEKDQQHTSDHGFGAAKKLVKKAVFCVDNVSSSCDVDDIRSFVANMSIDVLSCFCAEPRRRRDESRQAIQRRAFRLCIADSDRDRLLDARKWPDSIMISEWYYISPEIAAERRAAATRRAGESRRDTSEPEENSAFHQASSSEPSAATSFITGGEIDVAAANPVTPVPPKAHLSDMETENNSNSDTDDATVIYNNGITPPESRAS